MVILLTCKAVHPSINHPLPSSVHLCIHVSFFPFLPPSIHPLTILVSFPASIHPSMYLNVPPPSINQPFPVEALHFFPHSIHQSIPPSMFQPPSIILSFHSTIPPSTHPSMFPTSPPPNSPPPSFYPSIHPSVKQSIHSSLPINIIFPPSFIPGKTGVVLF